MMSRKLIMPVDCRFRKTSCLVRGRALPRSSPFAGRPTMRNQHPRPWRRGSDYTCAPRNALDRDQRHIWRRRIVAEARAGNLPGKAILTAEALLACMGSDGALYPSQQALADKAGVGVRTVVRHIDRMVDLGLVRKHRRLERRPWPEGGRGATRVQQTSNAYELLFPSAHVTPKPCRMRLNTGCHSGPEETERIILPVTPTDRSDALKALEEVRIRRATVLAANWASRVSVGAVFTATFPSVRGVRTVSSP